MKQYTANDYGSRAVKAAHRVLIELTQVLNQYEEHTAIVGGWVPPLLMPHSRHIGSIDVDLAIDHKAIQGAPFGPIQPLQVPAPLPSSHHCTSSKQFAHLRGFQMFAGASGGKVVGSRDALAELTFALMAPPSRGCKGGHPVP